MSKMGQYFFEMQEDATEMTKDAFLKKYGKSSASTYVKIQLELDGPSYDYTEEQQYYEEQSNDISF